MQYILSPEWFTWQGKTYQAKLITSIPSGQDAIWWRQWISSDRLTVDPKLTYAVPSDGPYPDNLYCLTIMELYSARLIGILGKLGINFESFPVQLVDDASRIPIPVSYFAFRLLDRMVCIDNDRSLIVRKPVLTIRKLVLNANCEQANLPMFRLEEFMLTVVNTEVRAMLLAEHITGLKCIPIEDFRVGFQST